MDFNDYILNNLLLTCLIIFILLILNTLLVDTIKRLISYPNYRSVEVINNLARLGSNHREVNYIKL